MIRSELFALLAISQANAFINLKCQMDCIKEGAMVLTQGANDIEEAEGLQDKLVGWNKVIHNFVENNMLTDVVCVNQPKDLDKAPPSTGKSYIFAGFYPPGHHHFLIYDPMSNRAYLKDVVADLNSHDNYPEYPPMLEKAKRERPQQNVWRKWIEDTEETEVIVYMNDLTSGFFDPHLVVKNEEELNQIHDFFKRERKIYKTYFREMIATSSTYPRINFPDLLNSIL